jgi:4,5-DOPA dioxygenase extradiol
MNAIADNSWTHEQKALGAGLEKPRAVVVVSAHWWTHGTFVQASAHPETIHDFGGFPRELFEVRYPAPGNPELASEIGALLGGDTTPEWGLDHGAWSVLARLFPDADVPVVQVSMDADLSPKGHLEMGRKLSNLRDRGILVLASGTMTHNLRDASRRAQTGDLSLPQWAERFDASVARAVETRDEPLLLALHATPDGRLAHPTPDHWFPLLWAYGASDSSDSIAWPVSGFDMGSMSMRSIRWG